MEEMSPFLISWLVVIGVVLLAIWFAYLERKN